MFVFDRACTTLSSSRTGVTPRLIPTVDKSKDDDEQSPQRTSGPHFCGQVGYQLDPLTVVASLRPSHRPGAAQSRWCHHSLLFWIVTMLRPSISARRRTVLAFGGARASGAGADTGGLMAVSCCFFSSSRRARAIDPYGVPPNCRMKSSSTATLVVFWTTAQACA